LNPPREAVSVRKRDPAPLQHAKKKKKTVLGDLGGEGKKEAKRRKIRTKGGVKPET